MTTAKKVSKKKVATEKKVTKKVATENKVEMVSYSMRMVIPTTQYANVQPEIIVKGGTMEEAHAYIAPHMNKLWKEYFMISERRPEPVAKPAVKPVATPKQDDIVEIVLVEPADSPVSDVAFTKATQAIESCLSTDALDLIIRQIGVSTKLTDEHKKDLLPVIEKKSIELNG